VDRQINLRIAQKGSAPRGRVTPPLGRSARTDRPENPNGSRYARDGEYLDVRVTQQEAGFYVRLVFASVRYRTHYWNAVCLSKSI